MDFKHNSKIYKSFSHPHIVINPFDYLAWHIKGEIEWGGRGESARYIL